MHPTHWPIQVIRELIIPKSKYPAKSLYLHWKLFEGQATTFCLYALVQLVQCSHLQSCHSSRLSGRFRLLLGLIILLYLFGKSATFSWSLLAVTLHMISHWHFPPIKGGSKIIRQREGLLIPCWNIEWQTCVICYRE